jgi:hypothetical protein
MRLGGLVLLLATAAGAYALGAASRDSTPHPAVPVAALTPSIQQPTTPPARQVKTTSRPEVARPANQPLRLVPQSVSTAPTTLEPAQLTETRHPKIDTKAVLTAAAVAALIVTASRNAYYSSGRPCACPDDRMRNGRRCGSRSAYSRPGGAAPKCFASDITAEMVQDYRNTTRR